MIMIFGMTDWLKNMGYDVYEAMSGSAAQT
jgi:hypothetical protein